MNKPLVVIVLLSIIYLLMIALSPGAQRVHGKFAKLEYGYISGLSTECSAKTASVEASTRLHYFKEKGKGKIKVDFFCYDAMKKVKNN